MRLEWVQTLAHSSPRAAVYVRRNPSQPPPSYKRIDGVQQALRTIADGAFDDGQRELVADSLAELTIPMLVLWGAEDRVIPAGHSAHAPERADVHVFEGCGHSPHMERAGEFNRAVEGFVAKAGSAGSPH